jgi:hypothetical protein
MPCAMKLLLVVRRASSFHDFDADERLVGAERIGGGISGSPSAD